MVKTTSFLWASITLSISPNALDTTFNPAGTQPSTTSTSINNHIFGDNQGIAVALQADNKIIIAGYTNVSGLAGYQLALTRLNPDGSLDATFNAEGSQPGTNATIIDGYTSNNFGNSLALQPDGKIVVAGVTEIAPTIYRIGVARFNADGTLDASFNSHGATPGTVTTTIDNNTGNTQGDSIAIQSDGKIVVGGYTTDATTGYYNFALARFNTDGSLDTTFNAQGTQPGTVSTTIDNHSANHSFGISLALQQDGKIILAGTTALSDYSAYNCALARFNTNGSLDISFNPTGAQPGTLTTTMDANTTDNQAYKVVVQSDGKILIAGFTQTGLDAYNFAVARLKSDGSLDTSFNPTGAQPGTASTTIDNNTFNKGRSLALQQNGKIVVAGITADLPHFGIARFNKNGSLDTTFNSSGIQAGTASTTIENNSTNNFCYDVALQSNGKIVAVGTTPNSNDGNNTGAARFVIIPITPLQNPLAQRLLEKYTHKV